MGGFSEGWTHDGRYDRNKGIEGFLRARRVCPICRREIFPRSPAVVAAEAAAAAQQRAAEAAAIADAPPVGA